MNGFKEGEERRKGRQTGEIFITDKCVSFLKKIPSFLKIPFLLLIDFCHPFSPDSKEISNPKITKQLDPSIDRKKSKKKK